MRRITAVAQEALRVCEPDLPNFHKCRNHLITCRPWGRRSEWAQDSTCLTSSQRVPVVPAPCFNGKAAVCREGGR